MGVVHPGRAVGTTFSRKSLMEVVHPGRAVGTAFSRKLLSSRLLVEIPAKKSTK